MARTETPNLKLIKPEITGDPEVWGNFLNGDMDKVDTWATTDRVANLSGLQTGAQTAPITKLDGTNVLLDDISFRTASKALYYTEALQTAGIFDGKPGTLVSQLWVRQFVDLIIPVRSIIMWGGVESDVPAGWTMCTGVAPPGFTAFPIPNLRGRFVLGGYLAADSPPGGDTQKIGGTNAANGVFNHVHPITVDNTALTRLQIPGHTHTPEQSGSGNFIVSATSGGVYERPAGTASKLSGMDTGNVGANGQGGAAAGHNHTASSGSNTTPGVPWYALAFIIKYISAVDMAVNPGAGPE